MWRAMGEGSEAAAAANTTDLDRHGGAVKLEPGAVIIGGQKQTTRHLPGVASSAVGRGAGEGLFPCSHACLVLAVVRVKNGEGGSSYFAQFVISHHMAALGWVGLGMDRPRLAGDGGQIPPPIQPSTHLRHHHPFTISSTSTPQTTTVVPGLAGVAKRTCSTPLAGLEAGRCRWWPAKPKGVTTLVSTHVCVSGRFGNGGKNALEPLC